MIPKYYPSASKLYLSPIPGLMTYYADRQQQLFIHIYFHFISIRYYIHTIFLVYVLYELYVTVIRKLRGIKFHLKS